MKRTPKRVAYLLRHSPYITCGSACKNAIHWPVCADHVLDNYRKGIDYALFRVKRRLHARASFEAKNRGLDMLSGREMRVLVDELRVELLAETAPALTRKKAQEVKS